MREKKPIIAISNDANIYLEEKNVPRIIACPASYAQAVAAAGGVPLLTCEQCPAEIETISDGLLLTGGKDIEPALYHEELQYDTVKTDEIRSAFEVELAKAFLDAGKPVFGVCRGSQLLNALLGGTIYQDLPEQLGFIHFDRALRHYVEAVPGSILHRLFGARFRVNSTHHQSVHQLAPGLKATALSPEGIIEAYEHESRPIFACQFHPERLSLLTDDHRTPDFLPLFEYFVALVRQDAAQRREA